MNHDPKKPKISQGSQKIDKFDRNLITQSKKKRQNDTKSER